MRKYDFTFKELPIGVVERDFNQPRKDFGTDGEKNRLLNSIKTYGIEEPLKVSEIEDDRYIIIDGHRRYICAQAIGMKAVPCRIYPKMSDGEFETRRYEMQNNRRSWKPLERSEALERIKNSLGFHTNNALADYLHVSKSMIQTALQLRKQKLDYIALMEKHNLSETYRNEFVTLLGKMRRIRDLEVDDIVTVLFEKLEQNIINRVVDLRELGKIFRRASLNESEIYSFLKKTAMTVDELKLKTQQAGLTSLVIELTQKITKKKKDGIDFSTQEKTTLSQLSTLLKKVI
jgi:ParB/RepB/Spo0J family partition protein